MLLLVSSAPRDRRAHLGALERHLAPLARAEGLTVWHRFRPRQTLDEEREQLCRARLVLALVSAHFFSDRSCVDALETALALRLPVVPIVVGACAWQQSALGGRVTLPRHGRPLNGDADWAAIAEEIRVVVQKLREEPGAPPPPPEYPAPLQAAWAVGWAANEASWREHVASLVARRQQYLARTQRMEASVSAGLVALVLAGALYFWDAALLLVAAAFAALLGGSTWVGRAPTQDDKMRRRLSAGLAGVAVYAGFAVWSWRTGSRTAWVHSVNSAVLFFSLTVGWLLRRRRRR